MHNYVVFGRMAHYVNKIGQQDQNRWFESMLSIIIFQNRVLIMDVVVRTYTGNGSKELFSLLESRKADIEKVMRTVKGFESYTLARSSNGEGGLSMTVCQDKEGIEESATVAKEWLAKNAANIRMDPPKVSAGSIIVHATKH